MSEKPTANSVVQFPRSPSDTEADRQRFEAWAGSNLRTDEKTSLLARSKGGDYVLATARAGWAAWQARGLGIVASGKRSALTDPRERVRAVEQAVRAICQAVGEDAADGTMTLLTAAAKITREQSAAPDEQILKLLAESLGAAFVAATDWFGERHP